MGRSLAEARKACGAPFFTQIPEKQRRAAQWPKIIHKKYFYLLFSCKGFSINIFVIVYYTRLKNSI